MSEQSKHRGYIGSRPYFGDRAPQHVQNLVIRDYCQRNDLLYLLSATEYIMDGCYVMLEEVLRELPHIDGVVLYSIFMLPKNRDQRHNIYHRILDAGAEISGAVENVSVRNDEDVAKIEEIWMIKETAAKPNTVIDELAREIRSTS